MTIPYALLALQNAETSNAVLHAYSGKEDFIELSKFEGALTASRDQEDDDKLQAGIDIACEKGIIDPIPVPAPYTQIDVLGKTPEQVADIILETVQQDSSAGVDSSSDGCLIVLVGLSGTGKGTTVSQLSQKLTALGKHVVTWSNGNVFRAVTLLATTLAEEQQAPLESVLTKDQLANFMEQISFTDKHDILIEGVGLVSEVQNTLLKSPIVSKSIPTVAQVTQGEVIVFCQQALQTLVDAGSVVLLEGRAQTVNYMSTPHRFELVLSDDKIIGQRRAAQRIMGKGIQLLEEGASEEQVQTTLDQVLHDFVMEIPKE